MFLTWLRALVAAVLVTVSGGLFHRVPVPAPAAGNSGAAAVTANVSSSVPQPVTPPVRKPPSASRLVHNTAFGYHLEVPSGWSTRSADGAPLAQTAHLLLSSEGQVVSIQICSGDLPCSRPPADLSPRVNREWWLAGVPATLYQYPVRGSDGSQGYENHLVADRGGHTYDIAWTTPTQSAGMPGGTLICMWGWG